MANRLLVVQFLKLIKLINLLYIQNGVTRIKFKTFHLFYHTVEYHVIHHVVLKHVEKITIAMLISIHMNT